MCLRENLINAHQEAKHCFTFFVIDSKSFSKFLLHALLVLFDQELGAQLTELLELQVAGSVLVNLAEKSHFKGIAKQETSSC